jgi:hypothetical protein
MQYNFPRHSKPWHWGHWTSSEERAVDTFVNSRWRHLLWFEQENNASTRFARYILHIQAHLKVFAHFFRDDLNTLNDYFAPKWKFLCRLI